MSFDFKKGDATMKRIIVTNNRKVERYCADKAEVILLEKASGLDVLREGMKVASEGGRLLLDPTRRKGFYKSLIFYRDGEGRGPDEKSTAALKQCVEQTKQSEHDEGKEPILAGILQNRDLNIVKSIVR